MPYKSNKQRKFFNAKTARRKGITEAMVHEFDQASKGKTYEPKVKKTKKK